MEVSIFLVLATLCIPVAPMSDEPLREKHLKGIPIKGAYYPIGPGTDDGLYNEFFEGDILYTPVDGKNAVSNLGLLWPRGTLVYKVDDDVGCPDSPQCDILMRAMDHYHARSCIRFKEWSGEKNYVRIFFNSKESGACWSPVGRVGTGEQKLSLGHRCWYLGIVVHELGHAIGFWHEMNRPDRDNWIYIFWSNILPIFSIDPEAKTGLLHHTMIQKLQPILEAQGVNCVNFKLLLLFPSAVIVVQARKCLFHHYVAICECFSRLYIFGGRHFFQRQYHYDCEKARRTFAVGFIGLMQSYSSAFAKQDSNTVNTLGETFDYKSVMMYDEYAFSKDGRSPTLQSKQGTEIGPIWKKSGLSASDLRRLKKLYKCDDNNPKKGFPYDTVCDFNLHTCGFKNGGSAVWNWRTVNETDGYVYSSFENSGTTPGFLMSINFHKVDSKQRSSLGCVRFWYLIQDDTIAYLKLSQAYLDKVTQLDNDPETTFELWYNDTSEGQWFHVAVPLYVTRPFRLIFESEFSEDNKYGTIALDDVELLYRECSSEGISDTAEAETTDSSETSDRPLVTTSSPAKKKIEEQSSVNSSLLRSKDPPDDY